MLDPQNHAIPESPEGETPTGPDSRTLKRIGIGAALVALAVVGIGTATRFQARKELETVAADAALPTVSVVVPQTAAGQGGLVLPGTAQAWNSAAIYARTNGYVRKWLADIGDRVGAGQPLAVLDAPEIDQQLAQAKADYQTALANQRLAATTSKRWSAMLGKDAVSQQEADEKAGDLAAKTALANAALANVRELEAQHGFTQLSAPFAGVVTSRSAQIGALVVAGNAAAQPLFTVSDTHKMRVYVRVPQIYSALVNPGVAVALSLPEFPGRTFPGTVTRSAGAVDAQSGAVLVEVQADNSEGALKPGAFIQAHFDVDATLKGVTLPGSAVLNTDKGPSVAVLGADNRVTVRPITIARDQGKSVIVSVGVNLGDRVVDSPPDSIRTGDHVQPQAAADAPAKSAAHGG
ncbi:RND family efflux transporter MFP subunit [Novosphingobium sp. PhB165]|uniref:efflux RND transporter periplasmic adaptor subunit n=1 Tax=Novosphingobium sp. PhB165 TaxID=2485105 RepID=UPI00104D22E5|nr:efflux RND transporter periplasmic adaptor subunit [Novosphingobium sp. PhB165]TCM19671.1 RND family efflux transporter MFP subunit [Novosphingobium sp. PhB165]